MLFWIFAAIMVGGIVWVMIDGLSDLAMALAVVGVIVVGVSGIIMMFAHCAPDADVAILNKRYESLVHQYENDIYENDNDIGKRELMVDIQEWNENLAMNRELQDNFWIGIFVPNIYDQFEFIELDKTSATQPSN